MKARRRRANPLLAVLGNPGTPIGRGVREIVYDRHATHGRGPWVHKFKRGDVEVRGLNDGRVLVESKAGARVWEKDGRAGWLTNPGRKTSGKFYITTHPGGGFRTFATKAAATRYSKGGKLHGPFRTRSEAIAAMADDAPPWLKTNSGGTVARRKKKKATTRRATAKRAATKRRRPGGKRKPPRGFKTWGAYMRSIRPATATTKRKPMKKRRKSRGGRRRSNPPAARHSAGRRRRGQRAGRRRNPPMLRGIVGTLMDGAKGGALVVAGKIVSRAVPALIGVQPVGPLGIGVQTAVGAAGALVLDRFVSRELSRPFLYGVFANAFESLIRGFNIPVLTPALGDETELHALAGVSGYVNGYVNGYVPAAGMGDAAMPTMVMGDAA